MPPHVSYTSYLPTAHGWCPNWNPSLITLHIVSDVLIAAAFFSIPIIMLIIWSRRRIDLGRNERLCLLLFAVFICLCGITHVFDVAVMYTPIYWSQGIVKAATAVASCGTAVVLASLAHSFMVSATPIQLQRTVMELEAKLLAANIQQRETAIDRLSSILIKLDNNLHVVRDVMGKYDIEGEGDRGADDVSDGDSKEPEPNV